MLCLKKNNSFKEENFFKKTNPRRWKNKDGRTKEGSKPLATLISSAKKGRTKKIGSKPLTKKVSLGLVWLPLVCFSTKKSKKKLLKSNSFFLILGGNSLTISSKEPKCFYSWKKTKRLDCLLSVYLLLFSVKEKDQRDGSKHLTTLIKRSNQKDGSKPLIKKAFLWPFLRLKKQRQRRNVGNLNLFF